MDMTKRAMATQAAMAAEIGARLGYMGRSKAWLQEKASVPSRTWQRYFTACDRDVPLDVVLRISDVLGIDAAELIRASRENAPRFEPRFMGLSADEQAALEAAIAEKMPPPAPMLHPVNDHQVNGA